MPCENMTGNRKIHSLSLFFRLFAGSYAKLTELRILLPTQGELEVNSGG